MGRRTEQQQQRQQSKYSPPPPDYLNVQLDRKRLRADPLVRDTILADNCSDQHEHGYDHVMPDDMTITTTTTTTTTTATTTAESESLSSSSGRLRKSTSHKRKLSARGEDTESPEPNVLLQSSSDVSSTSRTTGQFDDADEEYSAESDEDNRSKSRRVVSTHSVKRRRSNEWPAVAGSGNGQQVQQGGAPSTGTGALRETRRSTRASTRATTTSATHNKGTATADQPASSLVSSTTMAASKATEHASSAVRPRQSRFVEGSMNDRISERPPSFLFEDRAASTAPQEESSAEAAKEEQHATGATPGNLTLEHRHSGIFRFGKAIASAFNPFASKYHSHKPDVSKEQQDSGAGAGIGRIATKSQKEIMNERQVQAKKAYAELKKTGFKGLSTVPDSAILNTPRDSAATPSHPRGIEPHIADQTFDAIRSKMDYRSDTPKESKSDTTTVPKTVDRVDRSHTSSVPPSSISAPPKDGQGQKERPMARLRSLYDLRKSNSALNLAATKNMEFSSPAPPERHSADCHQMIRQQKSRKDLAKHAKLLKRVSNLEDKLEKARQELREVAGEDLETVPSSLCHDTLRSRHNVHTATLPSLPSERLLQSVEPETEDEKQSKIEAKAGKKRSESTARTSQSETDHTPLSDRQQAVAAKSQQPRKLSKSARLASRKAEAKSKKRKPLAASQQNCEDGYYSQSEFTDTENGKTPAIAEKSDRHSKSQKCNVGDSPGSASKRQESQQAQQKETKPTKKKDTVDPAVTSSKSPSQRLTVLKKKSGHKLRSKKGANNLRQAEDADAETSESDGARLGSAHTRFYHHSNQSKHQLEPKTPNTVSVPVSPSSSAKAKSVIVGNDENVPPVPPVPQDLLMANATPSLLHMRSRNLERIDETNLSDDASAPNDGVPMRRSRAVSEGFTWPEDIF